jgi:hypothetical protein
MMPWPWPDPRTRAGLLFYTVVGLAIGFILADFGWRI